MESLQEPEDDVVEEAIERAEQKQREASQREERTEQEHQHIEKLRKALPRAHDLDWLQKCEDRVLRKLLPSS